MHMPLQNNLLMLHMALCYPNCQKWQRYETSEQKTLNAILTNFVALYGVAVYTFCPATAEFHSDALSLRHINAIHAWTTDAIFGVSSFKMYFSFSSYMLPNEFLMQWIFVMKDKPILNYQLCNMRENSNHEYIIWLSFVYLVAVPTIHVLFYVVQSSNLFSDPALVCDQYGSSINRRLGDMPNFAYTLQDDTSR